MESVSEERFVFDAEWFDQQADLVRKYLLTYYPKDSTIEMVSCFSMLTLTNSMTAKTNACSLKEWPEHN